MNAELAHSMRGYEGLREKLLRMDTSGSGLVHADEVILAFAFVGLQLSKANAELLLTHFGTSQAGMLDVRQLLRQMELLGSTRA